MGLLLAFWRIAAGGSFEATTHSGWLMAAPEAD